MFSPMQIQWKQKWLSFLYNGVPVTLHGIQDTPSKPFEIVVNQLLAMEKDEAIWGAVQVYAMETPTDSGMTPLPKGL